MLGSLAGVALTVLGLLAGGFLAGAAPGALFAGGLGAFVVILTGVAGAAWVAHGSGAWRSLRGRPGSGGLPAAQLVTTLMEVVGLARKEGLLAIEGVRAGLPDAELQVALKRVVDGADPASLREMFAAESDRHRAEGEHRAAILLTAAQAAPSAGVLGAVVGLIAVLAKLEDPAQLGAGLASAFLSVLYGVTLGSLWLGPCAERARSQGERAARRAELIGLGALGIAEAANPAVLQERLRAIAARDGSG